MKKLLTLGLAALLLTALLAACVDPEPEAPAETPAATAAATEAPATEAPATEAPATEAPTEAPATEAPATEAATEELDGRPDRDDWEKDDPLNPYYNLIEVGTSYDGKTPCYDGRYDFGYPICHDDTGMTFSSMQDAFDYMEYYGGNITMDVDLNVCLKIDVPDDGNFYRIAYWWKNVDFVMNYGVIYDDQNLQDGIVGYAYYSDLYQLDIIPNLEETYVWVLSEAYGLEPGYYRMVTNDNEDSELIYGYDLVATLDEWPGLPNGEILED